MTKSEILATYLSNLQTMYAGRVDYSPGSKPYLMACDAAKAALAGKIRLEGDAWFAALRVANLSSRSTKAQIAALPE